MQDKLVEKAATDPGMPFEPENLAQIIDLRRESRADYERLRDQLKQHTDVRVSELDKATKVPDATVENDSSTFLDPPDPWPYPVDGGALLDGIAKIFKDHMVLPKGAEDMLALWVLHAHAHESARISPILAVTSPTPECGKTTLLMLLGGLVPKPLPTSNITPAALFRAVEKWQPTLLIDEADTFLPTNNDLRGIIDSGHNKAQAFVVRTVGENHEPKQFATWAPKAIALIGKLPVTLSSRAIHIKLRRMAAGDSIEPARADRLDHLKPFCQKAARWAIDHNPILRDAEPKLPVSLGGRTADNWRHMIAIADAVDGDWPDRARSAALIANADVNTKTNSILLLEDIRDLFEYRKAQRLLSAEIAEALAAKEDRPWPEWKAGKAMTPRQIAKLLEPFGIGPETIRTNENRGKGYFKNKFKDAFSRYLEPIRDTVTTVENRDKCTDLSVTTTANVTDGLARKTAENSECHGVTDSPAEPGWKARL